MSKRLTLQASGENRFVGYECERCGSHQVLACDSNTPYCAYCGEQLNGGEAVSRAEITASPGKEPIYVKCVSCDSVYAVDGTEETAAEVAASKYCPVCAGDSLIACTAGGEACDGKDCNDDPANDPKYMDGPKDELGKPVEDDKPLDDGIALPQQETDYTEMDASTHEDLQWNAVDTSEGELTAMIAASVKTGNPVAIFHKKNAPETMQPLFAQTLFVSAFNEVAQNEGMASAIKAFGGSYFNAKVLTAADIEQAALAKMEATAIPKLVDCCQIAVEGGTKGIYPDVYTTLQSSIVNELVASGIDSERATQAVANTFAIHGSDLFGTIMAKAMELFTKPDTVRAEAKALIMQASVNVPSGIKEQNEVRKAMEKPTPNFGITTITASTRSKDELKALRRELF